MEQLDGDKDFIVKESQFINIIAGSVLFIVFLISFSINDTGWYSFFKALGLFVIPAAFFFVKSRANKIIIKINNEGFFYYGDFITDWDHYIDSTLSQKDEVGSIKDDFILTIQYYDDNKTSAYSKEIPLTNTQDKSEEEILAAIQFYYDKAN